MSWPARPAPAKPAPSRPHLAESASFLSDQREVWDGIAELQSKAGAPSPTSAMSDVFKAREDDLRQCAADLQARPQPSRPSGRHRRQRGGPRSRVAHAAYAKLHPKLIHSYALESLLEPKAKPITQTQALDRARAFLDHIQTAQATPVPLGRLRHRPPLQAKALAGTALVHENEVIHAAFFSLDE